MKREELAGSYPLVVSLGAPCQVAHQMKRHHLRKCSLPFDWTVLESVPCLIKAIENNFDSYFARENLMVKGKHDHTYLIFDERYQCMSVHDFPHVEHDDLTKIFNAYPQFIDKMRRRIQRFYSEIYGAGGGTNILFIRYHASYEDARSLSECLKRLTNNHYKLIVLNEAKEKKFIEENWEIENTYAARVCQTADVPWSGYDAHWDIVLEGITLDSTDNNGNLLSLEEFDPAKRKDLDQLHHGIHQNESTFHWLSPDAVITLNAQGIIDKGLQINMETPDGFIPDFPNMQPASKIIMNGELVKTIYWDLSRSYTETISPDLLPMPNKSGAYQIEILTNGKYNPKEMGISEDNRDLAIRLSYMGAVKQ
ncbi:MAG: hypothetical protein HFG14_12355 [Lachnospiraceae bacterium]|jgi:hypothetical protein|nr:hypothetical protein [Lachnospiraceae bacterium]